MEEKKITEMSQIWKLTDEANSMFFSLENLCILVGWLAFDASCKNHSRSAPSMMTEWMQHKSGRFCFPFYRHGQFVLCSNIRCCSIWVWFDITNANVWQWKESSVLRWTNLWLAQKIINHQTKHNMLKS